MLWKKPANLKYTDLCIYIDENVEKIIIPDEYPEIEDTIYNYLWLLVKALAIKKRMFKSFQDYDGYAFYAAKRLFYALRKNLQNQGKVIKGKEIRPIKSCLNYTKVLLNPMRIEYLRENADTEYNYATTSKTFDAFCFKERVKESITSSQGVYSDFKEYVQEVFNNIDTVFDKVLVRAPFQKGTVDYKKLKISMLLNCLGNLKRGKSIDTEPITTQVWKLPKSTAAYVKVFIKSFGAQLRTEIIDCYNAVKIDDRILDYMLSNPDGEFIEHEE